MIAEDLTDKKVVALISFKDFRDIELFVPREILRKAGVNFFIASNSLGSAIGADGGDVEVDFLLEKLNIDDFDAVLFIGGPGSLKYLDNEISYNIAKETVSKGKILASICISPVILAKAGALKGKKATVWSSAMNKEGVRKLEENGAHYIDKNVVVDNNIITANGPDSAEDFANKIIELLTR